MSNVIPFNHDGAVSMVPEQNVTPTELVRLLCSLVIDSELVDDQIFISDGLDTACAIKFYEEAKLIQFETQMVWKQSTVPTLRKLNQAHVDLVMVRFYLLDRETMCADYFMTYDGGLNVPQFVRQLRRFAKIATTIEVDPFGDE